MRYNRSLIQRNLRKEIMFTIILVVVVAFANGTSVTSQQFGLYPDAAICSSIALQLNKSEQTTTGGYSVNRTQTAQCVYVSEKPATPYFPFKKKD